MQVALLTYQQRILIIAGKSNSGFIQERQSQLRQRVWQQLILDIGTVNT